ncbi:PTS sugar transporter subunit IIB [Actinomyces wuliandei]|uniref:PTS sugar transporter subunit IIB n=1 Tax=Actinomyces wuliandei TaxID=2057743 RepID=UPI000FDA4A53|nr:PTS sugar transporter subunit IIB [Actinomyces wuliandei]
MTTKVVVACGSGVATSQTVASKVSRLLKEAGVEADVQAVDLKSVERHLRDAAAYISIVQGSTGSGVPEINGIAFLTGVGQDEEMARLVAAIRASQDPVLT